MRWKPALLALLAVTFTACSTAETTSPPEQTLAATASETHKPATAPLYDMNGISYEEWLAEGNELAGSHQSKILLAERNYGSRKITISEPIKQGQTITHSLLCPEKTAFKTYVLLDGQEFGAMWAPGCSDAAIFTAKTPPFPHDIDEWEFVIEVDANAPYHAIVTTSHKIYVNGTPTFQP